ncbi:MAG: UPF0179 family protein [Thermoplasmata archaeon]|nr:UPF0179 family protein [Thermoplasmata archaeon]
MAEITLIARSEARPGFEFVYLGGAAVCRTCPYRHACLTLDAGRNYRITAVRPVTHPCALQETEANVVEVAPISRSLVVESPRAIVGSTVEVGRYACNRLDCPNWGICAGPSLPPKQRFVIEKVDAEPAECRVGRNLRRIDAR